MTSPLLNPLKPERGILDLLKSNRACWLYTIIWVNLLWYCLNPGLYRTCIGARESTILDLTGAGMIIVMLRLITCILFGEDKKVALFYLPMPLVIHLIVYFMAAQLWPV